MNRTARSFTAFAQGRGRLEVAVAMGVFGLLLWARLIIISDMPRTAIADDPVDASDKAPARDDAADPPEMPIGNSLLPAPRLPAGVTDIPDFAGEAEKSVGQVTEDRERVEGQPAAATSTVNDG